MKKWIEIICVALLVSAPAAYAHVGSPDVYAEGQAGPYKLSIVVRPPLVIPGVAEIDVRAETAGIEDIAITPLPMVGEASKLSACARHDAAIVERSRSSLPGNCGSWLLVPGRFGSRSAATK